MLISGLNPSVWYWVVTAVWGALLAWLLAAGRPGPLRWPLTGLALMGLLWSAGQVYTFRDGLVRPLDPAGFLVEMAWLGAWFLLLRHLLQGPYGQSLPDGVRRYLGAFWLLMAILGSLAARFWYTQPDGQDLSGVLDALVLMTGLVCMALAAQLRADAALDPRQALSPLVGAAALCAGGQVLTSGVALLAYGTPALLIVRALMALAAVALLARVVWYTPLWSTVVFVAPQSRSYVPRFMAMVGVLAVLLAVMPFFRSMEPRSAQPLAVLLIALGGLPVMALLFSQELSARARVYVSKRFLPFRYDYREEWLRLTATLVSPDQPLPLPQRVIKAVAQIVGSPAGLLWVRREPDGALVCAAGWNTPVWSDAVVLADDPAIRFMMERQWILDTAELARKPAMYDGLKRPQWLEPFPQALLLVPLVSNETLIGFMLLQQSSSAFRLTFEEIDLLRTSGRQVAAHLAQYEADRRLAEAKQFEAFNRLTAFMMHDLKNLIAQQSLVVRNAARHKGNPAFFEDAIATIDNSVVRMSRLLAQLQSGEAGGPRSRVRIGVALQEAIERCKGHLPAPQLTGVEEGLYALIDRERFTMVLGHLIKNAQEATAEDGRVSLQATRDGDQVVIRIEDTGCGMDAEFIRIRLFQPFDTTKGSKGMGIGAYQARSLVVDAGGSLEVESAPGRGTCITIRLPTAGPADTAA